MGNSIGANNVQLAKRIFKVTSMISLATFFTGSISVYCARFHLAKALTKDSELILMVAKVIPFLSVYFFPDAC